MDEEGEANDYVSKLAAKPYGPVSSKYLKRYPLYWQDQPIKHDFYVSPIEKVAKAEENGIEYNCLSCGKLHDIENETMFLKVIVGDSLLKHFFDGTIDGNDETHFDYFLKSGLKTVTACQEYLNLYCMEKKTSTNLCGIRNEWNHRAYKGRKTARDYG